ncbi:hypothetical protein PIB30_046285 [Stylosanthes scabra]|uniref:Phototropic-responsive NPH3 family protein n=1 Tax=Stylosanthes scabra TaxID=79078 RepID=A0ABU6QFU0_9FABA|nr:hypothetical protein [Stylosanthes scabra]
MELEACCDVEVDINGEETFMMNKTILTTLCRKFSNLFGNLVTKNVTLLKVIFKDFPGGSHGFELVARLCYCYSTRSSMSMSMELFSPTNVALLCSAADFLEIESMEGSNLKPHVEKFLQGIRFWTWCELLEALKQCQGLFCSNSKSYSYSSIVEKMIVDQLIERVACPSIVTSPFTCSSDRSSFQFSSSSISSINNSNCFSSLDPSWWFEDLVFLKIGLVDKVIRAMISHDFFDHGIVSKFLFYYLKSKANSLGDAAEAEKIETTKVVINLLSLLRVRSIRCKDLFDLNRVATRLKISRCCRNEIERLIGALLDQATIDYLILPSPHGMNHAYDVDFVLRLMHTFFFGSIDESTSNNNNRLKRVVKMLHLFLLEVSPDPNLKPCEFEALITVAPDAARESHDQLYIAMDIYLKVHAGISDDEKMSICSKLKHEKLSAEVVRDLSRNLVFPSETKARGNVNRQRRMKSLLQENDHLKSFFDSMFLKSFKNIMIDVKEDDEEIHSSSGTQLASLKKTGIHTLNNAAVYLPKLCS